MNIDLAQLSLTELHDLIAQAQQALTAKQKQERKHIIAQMQALVHHKTYILQGFWRLL